MTRTLQRLACLIVALMAASWSLTDPVEAVRGSRLGESNAANNQQEECESHRRLFGERIGTSRFARGGEAGKAKNFQEFSPMKTAVPATEPTLAPAPTTAAPTDTPAVPTTGAPVSTPTASRTGCTFQSDDGTTVSYEEGERLDDFITLDCFNRENNEFDCFCDSREPSQRVCPYCTFQDVSQRTICAKNAGQVTFLAPGTGARTTCQCRVLMERVPPFTDYTVTPSCVLNALETPTVPQKAATVRPTSKPQNSTFVMGRLNKEENGLILSEGLSSAIIAKTGNQVLYPKSGKLSATKFHTRPSGGDTFEDTRGDNPGGWVYLSSKDDPDGGIGRLTMIANGDVIDYSMIAEGVSATSNGGKTPWNTWVMGERDVSTLSGAVYQVDPLGDREAEVLALNKNGGAWEGFTADYRDFKKPVFYMSEDSIFGAIHRFIPSILDTGDPWKMLHDESGKTSYLIMTPRNISQKLLGGTFSWTNEVMLGRTNAAGNYPEAQGIDTNGSTLSFVCQGIKRLFQLNLDDSSYTASNTTKGLMEGEPNEIRYVEGDSGTLLYMTELNGRRSGVHARNEAGELYTVLEGNYQPETAGFALSPNGKHMYVSFKRDGLVFDITRDDGLSFFDAMSFESSVVSPEK